MQFHRGVEHRIGRHPSKSQIVLGLLFCESQQIKHFLLQGCIVYSDGTTTNFISIQYQIIGIGLCISGVASVKSTSSFLGTVKGWCMA